MRLRRLRRIRWVTGLGLAALVLNLLVPVHLAFDLAEALDHPHHHAHAVHSSEWRLLALASGHFESRAGAGHHNHRGHHRHGNHDSACQVCSAAGTLAGFAPAGIALLPFPALVGTAPALAVALEAAKPAATAGYRSRAPPLS